MLVRESGEVPGNYRVSTAPYQKEMQDCFNDPYCEEITYMMSSRMGKTRSGKNIVAYCIEEEPFPMEIIAESEKKGKNWSKIELDPMIAGSHTLKNLVADSKTRSKDNEILYKTFPGGYLVIGGANTPTTFSAYGVRLVYFLELDRFPPTVGVEGNPVKLGRMRAMNYLNRKFLYDSTPTVEEISNIWTLWQQSDQRFYKVPCPHCKHEQILVFGPKSRFAKMTSGFLKFSNEGLRVTSVEYICANCKKGIKEQSKTWMLSHGHWWKSHPEVTNHAGFHLNQLYSPWVTWTEIATEFLKAKNEKDILTFVNTILGEPYSLKINYKFDEDQFLARREKYTKIPLGVIILTIGIDTQDDRLEAVVKGWGMNGESWFIEKYIAWGSPALESTWTLMENFIFKERQFENGYVSSYGQLGGVYAVGVDTSGHHTAEVYDFVKKYAKARIFGIVGRGGFGKVFVKPSKNKKVKASLIIVGVDAGKQLIYERLQIQQLKDEHNKPLPTPGYMHFNESCDKEYFDQLTSEHPTVKGEGLKKTIVWDLPAGKQNEKLDCENYALAAYTLLEIKDITMLADELKLRMEVFERSKPGARQSPVQQTNEDAGEGNNTIIQIDM